MIRLVSQQLPLRSTAHPRGLTAMSLTIAEGLIEPLVNLTSMTDVVQVDTTLLHVEFVEDAVIACSQLEFRSALKFLVGEICQP